MKKNIILIGVAAAAIIGFGYFALFSTPAQENFNQLNFDQENIPTQTTEVNEIKKIPEKGLGSMDELRLSDSDLECVITYTQTESDQEIVGTFFTNDKRIRADFLIEAPDRSGQILSSMIIDNDVMFIWSEIDGDSYGFKTSLSKESDSEVASNEPVSIDENVAYDCKLWELVDNTVFLPPAYVLFSDLDQLKQRGMEYGNIYDEQ